MPYSKKTQNLAQHNSFSGLTITKTQTYHQIAFQPHCTVNKTPTCYTSRKHKTQHKISPPSALATTKTQLLTRSTQKMGKNQTPDSFSTTFQEQNTPHGILQENQAQHKTSLHQLTGLEKHVKKVFNITKTQTFHQKHQKIREKTNPG